MRDLGESVIAITGGSRGIGAATSEVLAEEGASVYVCGRSEEQLEQIASTVVGIDAAVVDIRDDDRVSEWLEDIAETEGRLDVLINNAGILGPRETLDETAPEEWRRTIDVNVNGTFLVTHHAYPLLKRAKRPLVVNISSSVGRKGRGTWGAYSVSKFAVEGIAEVAADELAGDDGCAVTLNPGGTATDMRAEAHPKEDPATLPSPEEVAKTLRLLVERLEPEQNGNKYSSRDLFEFVGKTFPGKDIPTA